MKRFKEASFAVVALVLMIGSTAFAGTVGTETVIGKFGFDWLHNPQKATCAEITKEAAAKFKSCTYMTMGDTGSFSGNVDFYKCQASEKSELMIYKTKARCNEELEIMKSHGEE